MKKTTNFSPVFGTVIALAITTSLAMTSTQAQAKNGWYVNLSAGTSFTQDSTADDISGLSGIELDLTSSIGPVAIVAIGRKFNSGWRLEGEYSYRSNDFDEISASGTSTVSGVTITGTGVPVSLDGNLTSHGMMLNAAYDFMKNQKWQPYFLGGVGGALVGIDDSSVGGVALADDDDFVFAYQAGVGVNYHLNNSVSFGLGYRFFGTMNPSFTASDNSTTFDAEYINHSVLVGLTFSF